MIYVKDINYITDHGCNDCNIESGEAQRYGNPPTIEFGGQCDDNNYQSWPS